MKLILPNFKKIKILVIGDIMLDSYYYGIINRISPEASTPIIKIKKKEEKPGGAANVAMNAASLGAKVDLIGLIGNDKTSSILQKILKINNIHCNLIKIKNYNTINKIRIISKNKQIFRIDIEKKIKKIYKNIIFNKVKRNINKINAIILSDYNKGTLINVSKIIKTANSKKIPIFIDPKGKNFEHYKNATLLTPNLLEFEKIVGKCINNKDIEKKGINLMNELNIKNLLITKSSKGMTLLEKDKNPIHIPTNAKNIKNVTGAGDTVISVLSLFYTIGLTILEASILANIAAGKVVEKSGTSTIKYEELKFAIKNYKNILKKFLKKQVKNLNT